MEIVCLLRKIRKKEKKEIGTLFSVIKLFSSLGTSEKNSPLSSAVLNYLALLLGISLLGIGKT